MLTYPARIEPDGAGFMVSFPDIPEALTQGGCGMSDLKPCPCGKTPERLIVHAEHSCPKWAWVTGSCCDGWGLEFRNDYAWQDSQEQMQKATDAWNTMERAGEVPAAGRTA